MKKCLNVTLTYDKDFKIFIKSSMRVCTQFLHDFIPDLKKSQAQVIGFRDPKLLSEADKSKSPILDVLTETDNKRLINVELQKVLQKFFGDRSVFYGARLMTDNLEEGKDYDKLFKTYVLGLVDFMMFKKRQSYYSHFGILCKDDPTLVLSDCLQFIFVELEKGMEPYKGRDLADFIDELDNRELWIYIIKRTPYLTKRDRRLIARRSSVMEEAMGIIERMDRKKGHDRVIAEYKEKARRDNEARKAYVFDQGLEKGMQRGLEQGIEQGIEQGMQLVEDTQRQFVVGLLDMMPPEQIAQRFGVPLEKVLEIQSQQNKK